MKHTIDKNSRRLRIHVRIRRAVKGSSERPRLAIFRSLKHIYAQIIDDRRGGRSFPLRATTRRFDDHRRKSRRREGDRQAGGRARD